MTPARIVYYAMGGGLGHLTRARAFLHTLGLERDAVIVAESPFASDRRVVGDIRVERRRPGGWTGGVPPARRRDGAEPVGETPALLILDTFPAGLFGEIEGGCVDYVARYVRWDRYALPKNPPSIGRAYVLEPLHPDQERYVRERAEVVIEDFELRDPPAAGSDRRYTLPAAYVLVVHSGPAEEIEELLAYARDVCHAEGVGDPIVLAAPTAVDVYPATLLAPRAVRIFTAGGFNAMRQFGRDPRHRPLPFERRFDDQYGRVARMRTMWDRLQPVRTG